MDFAWRWRRRCLAGDRGQFLVEKLTELGVTDFVPLRTARSVVHPKDIDKLRRHVIEASKQCGRNVLMRVAPVIDWKEYAPRNELAVDAPAWHTPEARR